MGYTFPSGVKSCPTYQEGLRLPRSAGQGVQRWRAKWARPDLLNPLLELLAGCCSPPVAGLVPRPGSVGRGPLALLFPSPAD